MTILCVLCTWHAIIASFDSESLEASFSGYLYLTLDEYNNQLAQIDNNQTNTNNTNETNQDWINKTDRVALIIFLPSVFLNRLHILIFTNICKIYKLTNKKTVLF